MEWSITRRIQRFFLWVLLLSTTLVISSRWQTADAERAETPEPDASDSPIYLSPLDMPFIEGTDRDSVPPRIVFPESDEYVVWDADAAERHLR
jgi:hypothetical protein